MVLYNGRSRWVNLFLVGPVFLRDHIDSPGLSTCGRERASYAGERSPVGNPCSWRGRCFACGAGFVVCSPLTHRLSFEMNLVCAVEKAIKNCVGKGGITDVLMPMLDGQLAGKERGACADAIIEQFEQIGALARTDGRNGEIIDHHEVHFGDGSQALSEAAICVTEAEFIEQARGAQVERREALAASLMGQGATQKRLAAAGCAMDEKILMATYPVAGTQARQLCTVKTAASAEVQVLEGSAFLELREL